APLIAADRPCGSAVDQCPLPGEPAVAADACGDEGGGAERRLVEQLEPARREAVEAVGAEVDVAEAGEPGRVQPAGRLGVLVPRLACRAEELDASVGLAPGLARVVDGDRGRGVRAQVARVGRAWFGEPDDLEVAAPGEVRRVDVGASAAGDG